MDNIFYQQYHNGCTLASNKCNQCEYKYNKTCQLLFHINSQQRQETLLLCLHSCHNYSQQIFKTNYRKITNLSICLVLHQSFKLTSDGPEISIQHLPFSSCYPKVNIFQLFSALIFFIMFKVVNILQIVKLFVIL